jgi:hypothetical protein
MYQKIRLIHPEGIENAVESIKCDELELEYIPSKFFEAPYFETKPIGEYKAPKKFPECCEFHNGVYGSAVQLINEFPNCCNGHKNLIGKPWFKRQDYQGIPLKLINTMAHTEYHIINRIDIPEWYRDITNYFDYCISSFGQLPDGHGSPVGLNIYLVNLKSYIKHVKYIPNDKKNKLIEYLEEGAKGTDMQSLSELNMLLTTYSKWLKIFPFQLSLFSHLKDRFTSQIPILKGELVENPYSGFAKTKLKTQQEFIEFLIGVTKNVLAEVNSVTLYKKNPASNFDTLAIELINSKRELELKELSEHYTDERRQYIKILKKWNKGECRYLDSLRPLITKQLPQRNAIDETPNDGSNVTDKIEAMRSKENIFWKGLPMNVVIDHFRVFTKHNSKNGKPFLTEGQFLAFMEKGFLGRQGLGTQSFNCHRGEKGFIVKRFYEFFELAVSKYGEANKKFKYISLIPDCFDNWSKDTVENFFKPNKVKGNW